MNMPKDEAAPERLPVYWPLDQRAFKNSYERLVLAALPRHLDGLGPNDLIVATEWWVFQLAKEQGLDTVHINALVENSAAQSDISIGAYMYACSWPLDEQGLDLSTYNGVSLGRLCGTFLTLGYQSIIEIHAALERLCRDLSPKRIELRDVSAQFFSLSDAAKRHLVTDIAARHGCEMVDRLDPAQPGDPAIHLRSFVGPQPLSRPTGHDRLRSIFTWMVETVFRIRLAGRTKRRRVFLSVSNLALKSMVEHFDGTEITPVIAASSSPKNLAFLRRCWSNGVFPAASTRPGDATRRRRDCAELIARVENHWSIHPMTGVDAVFRQIVRDFILPPAVLEGLAQTVDSLAGFLDRLQIRHVVVADAAATQGRALCELARIRQIWTDESLNGVFVSPVKEPTRCGHGLAPAVLDRQLAFGQANARWMKEIGSPARIAITGYPALGHPGPGPGPLPRPTRPPKNALVLPVYAWTNDPTVPRAVIVPLVVNMVRALSKRGFTGIRVKLHPSVDNVAFYRNVANHFGLNCDIPDSGNFEQHLDWADVVIGPVGTSCFLETLAAGKPYYVLRPEPTTISDEQLPGAVVAATAEALADRIADGELPDREKLLEHWVALNIVQDPLREIWAAIKQVRER